MMRKTIALMTLSVGMAILTPMPSAGVPLRPLYAQKQDDCCQSERLGLDEQIWTQKVNQETGDRYWRRP